MHQPDLFQSLRLIKAKVKICSKGDISIPKLELAATVVGVHLHESLIDFDDLFRNATVYFWTDSMAALRWI